MPRTRSFHGERLPDPNPSSNAKRAAIYGSADTVNHKLEGGFAAQLLALCEELRGEGVAIGTSELLDTFHALALVQWADQSTFRETAAATLAKSVRDRKVFDAVFDRFFFRAAEAEAIRQGLTDREVERQSQERPNMVDAVKEALKRATTDPQQEQLMRSALQSPETAETVRQAILEAISRGATPGQQSDLAQLAIVSFGGSFRMAEHSEDEMQRVRRELGLREAAEAAQQQGLAVEQVAIQEFERVLRGELQRRRSQRLGELPTAKSLSEQGRMLTGLHPSDREDLQRIVRLLRRRLRTRSQELRGQQRRKKVDVRATMRESLQTGGVPIVIKEKPVRPNKPELFILCDISSSVAGSSTFFISVMHALHETFQKMRSFVFIERISEVTDLVSRERDASKVGKAISEHAKVADISGKTNYGKAWAELLEQIESELHPRATVIVLGDARTNNRDPEIDSFAALTEKAGRTIWLNPESREVWDEGDSVIGQYAEFCEVHECRTAEDLEAFVASLTKGRNEARRGFGSAARS